MWTPDPWQPLPSNEWLLTLADHCHNRVGNRGYGTFAVGAVGETSLKVQLVIGVNSSVFHEVKLTLDQNVPPAVRNAIELASVEKAQEPYHAEVSCVLWARQRSMKLFAVASSRQVCPICKDFLARSSPTTQVVDVWRDPASRRNLTQKEREEVNLGSGWAARVRDMRAVYSHAPAS